jgi:hypothetical protein
VASTSSSVNRQQIEKDAVYARNLQMYQADPDHIIDVDSETMGERKPAAKSNSPIDLVDSDSGVTPPPTCQVYHPINTNTTVSSSLLGNVAPVTKALSARDKEAIRSNNARESLNIIKKYNSKKLHNNKVRAQLTTPQKAARADAKKRKTMLKECAAMDDNASSRGVKSSFITIQAGRFTKLAAKIWAPPSWKRIQKVSPICCNTPFLAHKWLVCW